IIEVAASDNSKLFEILLKMNAHIRVVDEVSVIKIFFPAGEADLAAVNSYCFNKGIILNHLMLKRKSLEAKFFELTNNN
ncbi:MAG: ABC transporter ATP-binding protein, partial [Ginsengibacter sp.]